MKSYFATPTPFGSISCFVVEICLSNYNLNLFLIHQASYSKGYQRYLMHREVLGSIWKIGRYPIKVSEVLYWKTFILKKTKHIKPMYLTKPVKQPGLWLMIKPEFCQPWPGNQPSGRCDLLFNKICLFILMLYIQVNNFPVISECFSWVKPPVLSRGYLVFGSRTQHSASGKSSESQTCDPLIKANTLPNEGQRLRHSLAVLSAG